MPWVTVANVVDGLAREQFRTLMKAPRQEESTEDRLERLTIQAEYHVAELFVIKGLSIAVIQADYISTNKLRGAMSSSTFKAAMEALKYLYKTNPSGYW
jgi:hypothetical protein